MAIITCPECGLQMSEYAWKCDQCSFPIAYHFKKQREKEAAEEAERLAQQQAAAPTSSGPSPQTIAIGLVVVGIIVALIVNANTPPAPKQYFNDGGTQSATPGAYNFQASGKVKLTYSCSLNSGKTATAELLLVDLKTSKAVWSKQVKCVTGNSDGVIPEYTDTVQLKASNYDVGIKMVGDGNWDMKITQA